MDIENPLTAEEKAQAAHYWGRYGNYALMHIIALPLLMIFVVIIAADKGKSFYPVHLMLGALLLFMVINYCRILLDKRDMPKKMEAIFEEGKESPDRVAGFISKKINGKHLAFPPKMYYQLQTGDKVTLRYTKYLHVVVSCEHR